MITRQLSLSKFNNHPGTHTKMLAYLYKYVGVMKRNWYLLDASEIELKSGIDPGENLVPPYEVGTIHHPYIRRHCLFFLSLPSNTNNALFTSNQITEFVDQTQKTIE